MTIYEVIPTNRIFASKVRADFLISVKCGDLSMGQKSPRRKMIHKRKLRNKMNMKRKERELLIQNGQWVDTCCSTE